jgi:hypothetical protein
MTNKEDTNPNVYRRYTVPESAGGLYLKFEDGKTFRVRIASEPVVYETVYAEGTDKESTSSKFAWIVWDVETKCARIMSLPVTAYRQVAALASDDEYGDPTRYDLKITRTGTALETKYEVIAGRNVSTLDELDADAPDAVSKVDLVERIRAGNGVHNVNWLEDAINDQSQEVKPLNKNKVVTSTDDDVVIEDIDEDEKPIDLSEIPF